MTEKSSMTALVSAFARAYHARHEGVKVFDDYLACQMLTEGEYQQIAHHMAQGIAFFNPGFSGSAEEALQWVVEHYLSPSPVGRAAYAERMLANAVRIGARQYLILAAGLDTFAYRRPEYGADLQVFEIDRPAAIADKQNRAAALNAHGVPHLHYVAADFTAAGWPTALAEHPAFDRTKISFCSMMGLTYYLSHHDLAALIASLAPLLAQGSGLVFDYPDQHTHTALAGERAQKQAALAAAAGEAMLSGYSYDEMEALLAQTGFHIYEHLTPEQITEQYFGDYNNANPARPMRAFDNVNYCLAVLKR
ncbi:MAG: class I SAM-dependent methyltransferase [Syntrophomonadaceae bacterium]|nr:class I SAM-dependent methyltransferase [Syntrophomonadaceae bacterium]